jgi:hypothetical protein
MHTMAKKSCTFHYNGDFSGNVKIAVPADAFETLPRACDGVMVTVAAEDLKAFVAEYVRTCRHDAIDSMNDEDLLRAWAIR